MDITNFAKRPIFRKDQFFEVTHFRSGRFRSYSFFEVNYFGGDRFKSNAFSKSSISKWWSEVTFRSDPLFRGFVLYITDALFSLHSKMSISKLLPKRVMMSEFIFFKVNLVATPWITVDKTSGLVSYSYLFIQYSLYCIGRSIFWGWKFSKLLTYFSV